VTVRVWVVLLSVSAFLLVGAVPAPASASPTSAPAASTRPNIVFVLTDDLSWNLVQYMPHVEQLERRGVTFEDYFVADSLCCPSRSSIFSGRFPHDTGVFTNTGADGGFHVFHSRGEESDTFATSLQAVGYRTAMMGKYLNGYLPAHTPGEPGHYVPPGWNEWDVAGNGYPEFNYNLNQDGRLVHYGNAPDDYLTDVLAGTGVSFIDQSAAAHQPFLLEVATFAPHAPYVPAPRDASRFPGLTAPQTPAFNKQDTVDDPPWLAKIPPIAPAGVQVINTDFRKRVQAVQAVDSMIGRLEAEVAKEGLTKNTYFVFSSDNGYHMGEHRLRPGKMTAFDTDIKVPLVVVGPGVPAHTTLPEIAQNIDLRSTFDQLGGASTPATVDGHSLVSLIKGHHVADWRNAALVEHHGPDTTAGDPDRPGKHSGNPPTYNAMRTPTFVYVEYIDGEREYYDVARDPNELVNLAGRLSASRMASLHAALTKMVDCHGASACWSAQHVPAG
jgi:N-acetylglucosamine-6-sulfatase